jgi:hypothetical protein
MELEEYLKASEMTKPIWNNEQVSLEKISIDSSLQLSVLVSKMVRLLSYDEQLSEKWAKECLKWIVSCPINSLVKRSLQIYRSLGASPSREAVISMIRTIHNSIYQLSNKTDDGGLTLELLYSLNVMLDYIPSSKILLFPHLFWTLVSLFYIDFDQIFAGKMFFFWISFLFLIYFIF